MDRMEGGAAGLDIEADRIDHDVGAGHRRADRVPVMDVGTDGLDIRHGALRPLRMARDRARMMAGRGESPHDARAEEAGAADDAHRQAFGLGGGGGSTHDGPSGLGFRSIIRQGARDAPGSIGAGRGHPRSSGLWPAAFAMPT
jgi:hypothetical protein